MLTDADRKSLESSQIYKYYSSNSWSSVSAALIEADLDAIKLMSIENLPLIKFLTMILQSKQLESQTNDLTAQYGEIEMLRAFHQANFGSFEANDGLHQTGQGTMEQYTIVRTQHILAGGVLANATLIAGDPAGNLSLLWFIASWDVDPAAAYTFDFHEAGGVTLPPVASAPPTFRGNRKVWGYWDCPTADTDMEVDIAGGAGIEVVDIIGCYITWG